MWPLYNFLGRLWCRLVHRSIMWAGGSHYYCRRCFRCFPVPWIVRELHNQGQEQDQE